MKLPKHRRDEAALNSRLIRRPIKRMVWLFLLPTFAAFCIGFLYPFFKGLFLSFCNFRITSQWTWTGLENYRKAFQDPGYMHAFWYTALFALVSLIVINLFAFTIAYALPEVQGHQRVPHGVFPAQPHRRHRAGLYLVHDL